MRQPNVFAAVTSTVKSVGPMPKFRGTRASPGRGLGLKRPNGVATAPACPTCASDGRSVNTESRLVSFPDVMLNGSADVQVMNGYTAKSPGRLMVPPNDTRCCGTGAAPHSAARFDESAGTL